MAAATIAPVGAYVSPLRTSAERWRCPRQRWSGNLPSASQPRQYSDVVCSARNASSEDRGTVQQPRPGERAVAGLAGLQAVSGPGDGALDADPQVADEAQTPAVAVVGVDAHGVVLDVLPLGRLLAVVEHRLAEHLDLRLTVDARDRPYERVVGLVVRRWTGVRGRRLHRGALAPAPDDERVTHDEPACRRHPGRLQDVRPGLVAPAGGDAHRRGAQAEAAGAAVQDRGEDARRVKARRAEPLDGPVRGHERRGVAVAQEAVVRDRRKRGLCGQALDERGGVRGERLGHVRVHRPTAGRVRSVFVVRGFVVDVQLVRHVLTGSGSGGDRASAGAVRAASGLRGLPGRRRAGTETEPRGPRVCLRSERLGLATHPSGPPERPSSQRTVAAPPVYMRRRAPYASSASHARCPCSGNRLRGRARRRVAPAAFRSSTGGWRGPLAPARARRAHPCRAAAALRPTDPAGSSVPRAPAAGARGRRSACRPRRLRRPR